MSVIDVEIQQDKAKRKTKTSPGGSAELKGRPRRKDVG